MSGTEALAAFRVVLRVRRAMRETRDASALLRSLTPGSALATKKGGVVSRLRLVRAILRLVRLLPVNEKGDCLLRSLAIYTALRERGWPAVLVTGVRREATGVVGHAWVELGGRVLPELKEPHNRARYRESFRYPPKGREPVREGAEYSPGAGAEARPG